MTLIRAARLSMLSLALAASMPLTSLAAALPADTPLIPRAALFGNPVKSGAQLSPDGKWLSWMAPVGGVMNVWVASIDKPQEGRALTDSKDRPISAHFWSGAGDQILFVKDKAGDDEDQLLCPRFCVVKLP